MDPPDPISLNGLFYGEAQGCSPEYGDPLWRSRCQAAFDKIPDDTQYRFFKAQSERLGVDDIGLPLVFKDNDDKAACVITIEIEGHSQTRQDVNNTWANVQATAAYVMSACVDQLSLGGWRTLGLKDTYEYMVPPRPYDPSIPLEADGSISTSYQFPPDWEPTAMTDFNVPSYLVVSIEGPTSRRQRQVGIDWALSLAFQEHLENRIKEAIKSIRWRLYEVATRTLRAVQAKIHKQKPTERWWEFQLEPRGSWPSNGAFHCVSNLGTPGIDACEDAMFDLDWSGPATLESGSPIIKTSGDCTIGVRADSKVTSSWEVITNTVVQLMSQCLVQPNLLHRGGWVRGKPVTAKHKRDDAISLLDPRIEISLFSSKTSADTPIDLCAWHVATAHRGDVRKCPVPHSRPSRPPEHELLEGYTETPAKGDATTVKNANGTDVLLDKNITRVFEQNYDRQNIVVPSADAVDTAAWATNTGTWEEE